MPVFAALSLVAYNLQGECNLKKQKQTKPQEISHLLSSIFTGRPGTAAHLDVLSKPERDAAEPAAAGRHLPNNLPRVRLVTIPLDSVVISARRAGSALDNLIDLSCV